MSSRSLLWSALVLLAFAGPVAAQPSPLELAQGLREAGMSELALEYLKEIEPKLSPADKAVVPLERAKCLLEAAEEEPDEGTRTSMINEAKDGFNAFLNANSNHPRASEASLALARLTSIEAKAQLNRARRMDIPPKDDSGHDAAIAKQKEEAGKATPMFVLASRRFADAAAQIKAKLDDKTLDPRLRQTLQREAFEADLAAAINSYSLADTLVASDAKGTIGRDKYLEEARAKFAKLAEGPDTSRTVWIARAWMAEVLGDQGKPNPMKEEFEKILAVPRAEAEDGKRLVRFFQLRREYLDALQNNAGLAGVEKSLRAWIAKYGNLRKPTTEALAARYYLAFVLQREGMIGIANLKPDAKGVLNIPTTPRRQFEEAEKLYRALSQSDNDYTSRSAQNRMFVVRRLLGEADRPAADYATFETAQMAALIQMAKMNDADRAADRARAQQEDDAPFWKGTFQQVNTQRLDNEVADRKHRVVSLLERARELATSQDNPADVTDNLLRLVYFYQLTNQPYQAAVLGEHIARTVKMAGGKGAIAGLLALNGYAIATSKIKTVVADATMAEAATEAAAAARRADRERAIEVAKFLDRTFSNDTATDAARHRLSLLLNDDGKTDAAFEAVVKIRPGYADIHNARQLEGYLAGMLLASKEGVPADRKVAVFRRAVGDLSRVNKPPTSATREDLRGYAGCRVRLAYLYLAQNRVDPETEKSSPGYVRALAVADELIGSLPSFEHLTDKDKKDQLNLEGMELKFQGLDVRSRALFLQAKSQAESGNFAEAGKVVDEAAAGISQGPVVDAKIKKWAEGSGDGSDEEAVAKQKKAIADLAAGIDKTRRDIVMVGFKLRCAQGDQAAAGKMLELLKSSGGGIEANQASLEFMARELAAQIPRLRAEGKAKEATDLGAGLTLLLNEFTTIKNLPTATILFLGQTYYTVEEFDKSLEMFKKVPVPSQPGWEHKRLEEFDQDVRGKLNKEIREYRFAQLYIAKALRGAKRFAEAEKHIQGMMGTPEKKGWAWASADVRKELGTLYEAMGAALTQPKAANVEWGKALREWTTLFQLSQNRLKRFLEWEATKAAFKPAMPGITSLAQTLQADGSVGPMLAGFLSLNLGSRLEPAGPDEVRDVKSPFFEAYLETQRVLVAANSQLLKGNPKLSATFEQVGRRIKDLETIHNLAEQEKKGQGIITPEVWNRYCDLIEKEPGLKNAYIAAGGKFFLERPKGG